MGAAASAVIGAISTVTYAVVYVISVIHSFQQIAQHPVMRELEQRARSEQRRRQEAERLKAVADLARERADEARQRAEKEKKWAEEDKRRAENEKRQAEESRKRAEEARQLMEQERNRAQEARQLAEERKNEADEKRRLIDQARQRAEAERCRIKEEKRRSDEEKQQADEKRRRAEDLSMKAEQDRQRAEAELMRAEEEKKRAEAEKIRAEQERKKAEEETKKAEEGKERARIAQDVAEKASAAAAEAAEDARAAQDEAERKLRAGIRPVVLPTVQQIHEHKERLQYCEGKFHFAVAGIAGSGKSSLINALRGIANGQPHAARVGITETTLAIARYEDANANRPLVWYDIPGAGTLSVPGWQYFNDFGLYIFDAIIVLFDNRFTETDVALLRNAARFKIPTYIVRSKSVQHISNLLTDLDFGDDEDNTKHLATARQLYIQETRDSIAKNLTAAELPEQRAYLIAAKEVLCKVIRGFSPDGIIDEVNLVRDIFEEARVRRLRAKPAQQPTRNGLLGTILFSK